MATTPKSTLSVPPVRRPGHKRGTRKPARLRSSKLIFSCCLSSEILRDFVRTSQQRSGKAFNSRRWKLETLRVRFSERILNQSPCGCQEFNRPLSRPTSCYWKTFWKSGSERRWSEANSTICQGPADDRSDRVFRYARGSPRRIFGPEGERVRPAGDRTASRGRGSKRQIRRVYRRTRTSSRKRSKRGFFHSDLPQSGGSGGDDRGIYNSDLDPLAE